MEAGAKKTKDALKKELAETKDQVRILKERTAEVRQGEYLVYFGRAVQRGIAGCQENC
jgi:hypothetical protein